MLTDKTGAKLNVGDLAMVALNSRESKIVVIKDINESNLNVTVSALDETVDKVFHARSLYSFSLMSDLEANKKALKDARGVEITPGRKAVVSKDNGEIITAIVEAADPFKGIITLTIENTGELEFCSPINLVQVDLFADEAPF